MKYRESNKFLFSYRFDRLKKELENDFAPLAAKAKAQHLQGKPHYAILFDATIVEEKYIIQELEKKLEKPLNAKVTLMAYLDHKAETGGIHFKHFNNKDRNYFFVPNNADTERFLFESYDLLINADLTQSLSLHYLACKANAYTKVGPHSFFDDYYHLILDTKDTFTIKQYISDLISILNKVVFNGKLQS